VSFLNLRHALVSSSSTTNLQYGQSGRVSRVWAECGWVGVIRVGMGMVDGVINCVISEEHVYSRSVRSLAAARSIVCQWAAVQAREAFDERRPSHYSNLIPDNVRINLPGRECVSFLEPINAYSIVVRG
jgi:hypothetical protein